MLYNMEIPILNFMTQSPDADKLTRQNSLLGYTPSVHCARPRLGPAWVWFCGSSPHAFLDILVFP